MRSPTTSSPGASPPESPPAGISFGDYAPAESAEALELERTCLQGASYRLAFRRETFHRRAGNFAVHRILTARRDGRLVAIAAAAIKAAQYRGRRVRAAFVFDLRVRPEERGHGVGRALAERLLAWADARSDLTYTYVMGENRAAGRLGLLFGAEAGGYATLAYPAYRVRPWAGALRSASLLEVHARHRAAADFDFQAEGRDEGRPAGHAGSWLLDGRDGLAGCSAWSNRGVLEEVVVSLPPALSLARGALALLPRAFPRPHLPRSGEAIRSWYLFDVFAPSPAAERDLLRAVAKEALERGIDWLYLAHAPGDPRAAAARRDVAPFAPVVPYRLLVRHADGSPVAPLRSLDVDVRDL